MGKINIVGAGLAGLSAAISLAENGVECNLISPQTSERAQSVLAEGGINAAMDTMGEGDSAGEHFADTIRGGAELADPNAVNGLVNGAPDIIRWLLRLGTPFQSEEGRLLLRNFGGQKKKRTAYAKSSTGKMIMSALIDEARKHEAAGKITRFPHHRVCGLVLDGGGCAGLKMYDIYTGELFFSPGAVILASGGLNGVFPEKTTGTVQNTGDIAAAAFAQGAELANLEFVQYHPTTIGIPGKRMLISEAARGEGGRLFTLRNGKRWYFMEELYPELGNLMPRDVISREIYSVCRRDDCGGRVYLDLTGLSGEIWQKRLSDMREEILGYTAADPAKEPIAVSPGIHFFMGGINVDEGHRASVRGLYAAGECACQYHGANRLGGNSMLGAVYGGRTAAGSAMKDGFFADSEIKPLGKAAYSEVSPALANKLGDILADGLGIVRNEERLKSAIDRTDKLLGGGNINPAEQNRVMLGKAMLVSALARRESRGAHCRSDYPERDDINFRKTTVCICRNGNVSVEFRAIPERRAAHEGNT